MGCVLKTSTLYKDMERIHGKEHSIDAYAMAYHLDDLMNLGLITTHKLVGLSNDKQISYTIPKPDVRDIGFAGYKKDAYLKKKLLEELESRLMTTVSVKEIGKATVVTVKPDLVLADDKYEKMEPNEVVQNVPLSVFQEDYDISEQALEEEEYAEPRYLATQRTDNQINNKQELKKVGVQLSLFNDDLSPEQSEIYLNFEKYYPSMDYLSDKERKDFVKLLSKGAIETKCKI